MNLIIEALFVGFYTYLISLILINPFNNPYFYLFIIGFIKHFLSYYLNIQNYYCNYKNNHNADNSSFFTDSIYEGIVFIFIGGILIKIFNIHLTFFLIGFIFHISSEYIGLHKYFIMHRCIS